MANSGKKPRLTLNGVVVADAAPPAAKMVMTIDKPLLDCPLCSLRPPTFLCPAMHPACGSCAASQSNKCVSCVDGAVYERSYGLDYFLQASKAQCPNSAYGCPDWVAYCLLRDHTLLCPHAPCRCPEQHCVFFGSPPALRNHLASHHNWVVTPISRQAQQVVLQATDTRRLLVTEDGELFLLVVSEGGGGGREVRLVRIRANKDAGPIRYWSTVWLVAPLDPENGCKSSHPLFQERVLSCAELTEEAAMEVGGRHLPVKPFDVHPGGEIFIRVRIAAYNMQSGDDVVSAAPACVLKAEAD